MFHLLYLTDDYPYSSVHHNLIQHLANLEGWRITIFCSLRESLPKDFAEKRHSKLNYRVVAVPIGLSPLRYRLHFGQKTRQRLRLIEKNVDLNSVDHILCSTTFSDGAVAYALSLQRNIRYSTIVRSTDTDFYLRWMPHVWQLGTRIIKNAHQVVAITPSIKDALLCSPIGKKIADKRIDVIPNGVHPYWQEHQLPQNTQPRSNEKFNILFVGDFSRNKNGLGVIKAFLHLQQYHNHIHLTLVGGASGDRFRDHSHKIHRLIDGNPNINYIGQIHGPENMATIFGHADLFVMVSHNETFGLAYIEALSQGLPIVYSKGHGIDGFFDHITIGEKADSHSTKSIANAMERILEHYNDYQGIGNNLQQFNWSKIAKEYAYLITQI